MALVPGQILRARYRIIRRLDGGNFGDTYLAEDLDAKSRQCVVKEFNFVSNNAAEIAKAKELFEREASVLLNFTNSSKNEHIPDFFAYFEESQKFYLVEEWIDGTSVSEHLRGGSKLQEDEVIALLEDGLKVLKFIHSKKIIHRDIKPEHLIRRDSGNSLVLIDFGAVKQTITQVNNGVQAKPTVIWTPGYAPREQRQGNPRYNSDIYALGMTAIEALTGIEPKELPEDRRTGNVIWRDQANVSKELSDILDKMVQDDCTKRYQSADKVLKALNKLKNQKTLVVSPGGQLPRPGVVRSMRVWLTFGILAPIVAIPAFFIALNFYKTEPPPPPPVKQTTPSVSPNPNSIPTCTTGIFCRPNNSSQKKPKSSTRDPL